MEEGLEQQMAEFVAGLSPEEYERLGPALREFGLAIAESRQIGADLARVDADLARVRRIQARVLEDRARAEERLERARRLLEDAGAPRPLYCPLGRAVSLSFSGAAFALAPGSWRCDHDPPGGAATCRLDQRRQHRRSRARPTGFALRGGAFPIASGAAFALPAPRVRLNGAFTRSLPRERC